MIDPSLRRGSHGSHSDANVAANASGVEKLLAASGFSAVLQASAAGGPSPSSPSVPRPAIAPSAPAASPAASLAGALPMLQLLARASAATNNNGSGSHSHGLVGAFSPAAQHFHNSLQSATAMNSALSSLARAIAAGSSSNMNNNSHFAAGIPDLIALSPTASSSSSSSLTCPASSYGAACAAEDAAAAAIRKEQIDAALKSKPQRGRKRENLNDHERMELTRTRNREHAKSTRIRKKARHEELLEMEGKFRQMEEEQAKNDACKDLVLRFFRMRDGALQSDDAQSSADHGRDEEGKHASSPQQSRLEEVMDENATFSFSPPGPPSGACAVSAASSSSNTSEHGDPNTAADVPSRKLVQELESFDDMIKAKVTRCLGQAALPMLSYAVQGGNEGIALNKSRTAFCRVDVMLAHSLALIRGVATFEFVDFSAQPSSSASECDDEAATTPPVTTKVASVQWVQIHDATEAGALKSIDPMVVVAMAAESAGALQRLRTEHGSSRLTASNISRHNDELQHRARVCANVSSSSSGGSGRSSVAASAKEEADGDSGEGAAAAQS